MSKFKPIRSPFVSSVLVSLGFAIVSFLVALGFTFSNLNNRPLGDGILTMDMGSSYRDYVIRGERQLLASEKDTARFYFHGDHSANSFVEDSTYP